jgi:arylsulfatase A-like enzyme
LKPLGRGYAPDPVVVLITVEALRADLLTDERNDTELPQLVAFRESGAYFPRAIAGGSQTTVTLTTMFTSRYFSQLRWKEHGPDDARFFYPVDDPAPRFTELLTAAGVTTSSYLGLRFLAGRFGVAKGFSDEHAVVTGRRHAHAHEVITPLLRKLRRLGGGGHLLYAHLLEPHWPYDRSRVQQGPARVRYVSEVAVVDAWLKRVVRLLRRRFPRRGYLVVTGDHGEAFGEHHTRFHSTTLYDELVRVPLIIWGPGVRSGRHAEDAGLVDIGPTIVHLFRLPIPTSYMGQSLLPLIDGEVSTLQRPLFAEGRLARAYYRRDGLKIIEDGYRKTVQAYDLGADPQGLSNLFDTERERAEPAVAALRAFFEQHAFSEPGYTLPYKR